jgi:DNA-binding CsgD family transcriptional regulator
VGGETPLTLDDLERHATAAHLVGDEAEHRDVLAQGYREALRREDVTRAARFAFWLGHAMIFTGEDAQANGWFARARSLLAQRGADCVEWGYLLIPTGVEQLGRGDAIAARGSFSEALAIGRRFADHDLEATAGHGLGRAFIRLDMIAEGMATLDEVMLTVTSDDVSPLLVGHLYCGVLEACQEVLDLRRSREWTAALARWCEGQPDLVPYRGPCLVHRVEVMRHHGDWDDAFDEARRACDWLSQSSTPEGAGDAHYELAELHRLRGDFPAAEEAYRQASRLGRAPEPGIALLWLARGETDSAAHAIRRRVGEPELDRARRAEMLSALVEIELAHGDNAAARSTADELGRLASELAAPLAHALADRAAGSVLIVEGEARAAIPLLRRAWSVWNRLESAYEAARTRVVLANACRALGDAASAAMEEDAARWIFEKLGAAHDLACLDATGHALDARAVAGLTPRETEVLTLIATGETNKGIAAALVISEHTVARHVQNMLQKLGFSSRARLAAYAAEQGLAGRIGGQN